MQMKHFVIIGGCLVSIGAMISAFHDWSEILKPAFIGGVLGVIGTQLAGIFSEKPGAE